jgi:hypothetical protein
LEAWSAGRPTPSMKQEGRLRQAREEVSGRRRQARSWESIDEHASGSPAVVERKGEAAAVEARRLPQSTARRLPAAAIEHEKAVDDKQMSAR